MKMQQNVLPLEFQLEHINPKLLLTQLVVSHWALLYLLFDKRSDTRNGSFKNHLTVTP